MRKRSVNIGFIVGLCVALGLAFCIGYCVGKNKEWKTACVGWCQNHHAKFKTPQEYLDCFEVCKKD